MKVHSSHLALRFYEKDGWNASILNPLLLKGEWLYQTSPLHDGLNYWIVDVGSLLDIDKLMQVATSVQTWKNEELGGENMRKFYEEMSW